MSSNRKCIVQSTPAKTRSLEKVIPPEKAKKPSMVSKLNRYKVKIHYANPTLAQTNVKRPEILQSESLSSQNSTYFARKFRHPRVIQTSRAGIHAAKVIINQCPHSYHSLRIEHKKSLNNDSCECEEKPKKISKPKPNDSTVESCDSNRTSTYMQKPCPTVEPKSNIQIIKGANRAKIIIKPKCRKEDPCTSNTTICGQSEKNESETSVCTCADESATTTDCPRVKPTSCDDSENDKSTTTDCQRVEPKSCDYSERYINKLKTCDDCEKYESATATYPRVKPKTCDDCEKYESATATYPRVKSTACDGCEKYESATATCPRVKPKTCDGSERYVNAMATCPRVKSTACDGCEKYESATSTCPRVNPTPCDDSEKYESATATCPRVKSTACDGCEKYESATATCPRVTPKTCNDSEKNENAMAICPRVKPKLCEECEKNQNSMAICLKIKPETFNSFENNRNLISVFPRVRPSNCLTDKIAFKPTLTKPKRKPKRKRSIQSTIRSSSEIDLCQQAKDSSSEKENNYSDTCSDWKKFDIPSPSPVCKRSKTKHICHDLQKCDNNEVCITYEIFNLNNIPISLQISDCKLKGCRVIPKQTTQSRICSSPCSSSSHNRPYGKLIKGTTTKLNPMAMLYPNSNYRYLNKRQPICNFRQSNFGNQNMSIQGENVCDQTLRIPISTVRQFSVNDQGKPKIKIFVIKSCDR